MSAWQEIFHSIVTSGADDLAKVAAPAALIGFKVLTRKYEPHVKKGWILYFRKKDHGLEGIDTTKARKKD